MRFVQDFLSFSSLGVLGVILVAIGVLGCLFHRNVFRLTSSAIVALAGALLILEGAAKLHGIDAPVAFVFVVGVVILGAIVRAVLSPTPKSD